jgi:predicted transcriptional regulator
MKTYKTRHQFYLPDDLSEKLDTLAGKPGASKTSILTDALRAWLDRQGANELDQRFGARLDRQSRAIERIEQQGAMLSEALGLFVQHQLPSSRTNRRLIRKRPGSGARAMRVSSTSSAAVSRSGHGWRTKNERGPFDAGAAISAPAREQSRRAQVRRCDREQ